MNKCCEKCKRLKSFDWNEMSLCPHYSGQTNEILFPTGTDIEKNVCNNYKGDDE